MDFRQRQILHIERYKNTKGDLMMKSYIAIQSTLFNGVIDLVGYTDMQGNIRLTHTSIYAYI